MNASLRGYYYYLLLFLWMDRSSEYVPFQISSCYTNLESMCGINFPVILDIRYLTRFASNLVCRKKASLELNVYFSLPYIWPSYPTATYSQYIQYQIACDVLNLPLHPR